MKRRFMIERVGRRRKSAARGMARLGFSARVIAVVLGLRYATASAIVASRPLSTMWSPAEQALFRQGQR
jgi:hypothetical protein